MAFSPATGMARKFTYFIYTFLGFSMFLPIYAQITTVSTTTSCGSGMEWLSNSEGQNPCYMFTAVVGNCMGVDVLGLQTQTMTPLLQPPYAEPDCGCSDIVYNLIAACLHCQGLTWPKQVSDMWLSTCNARGVYDNGLPGNVLTIPIPLWAQLDPSMLGNDFAPDAARQIFTKGIPDATDDASINKVALATSTVTMMTLPTLTLAPTSTTDHQNSSLISTWLTSSNLATKSTSLEIPTTKVVASRETSLEQMESSANGWTSMTIVGAVIGGLVALLACLGCGWWILRRKAKGTREIEIDQASMEENGQPRRPPIFIPETIPYNIPDNRSPILTLPSSTYSSAGSSKSGSPAIAMVENFGIREDPGRYKLRVVPCSLVDSNRPSPIQEWPPASASHLLEQQNLIIEQLQILRAQIQLRGEMNQAPTHIQHRTSSLRRNPTLPPPRYS